MAATPRICAAVVLFALSVVSASAQDKPTLNVYTYDSFASEWGPGPALKTGFEQQCGCTVQYTAAEDAISMLRRVQLEGETTAADVLVGLDTSIAGEARATGLFAPHGLDLSGLTLPAPWTDADFVPFDFGYFAFVYDTDRTATPPDSFEALIAEPDSFKIAIQDPRSSTPGLGLLLWIKAAYGDRAPDIWAGLKPHIVTMTRGWSEAYGLFLSGEADMALSYTSSPFYHAISENDDTIAAATFTEGHYPQIEVAGLIKGSDQAELGRQFLQYLISQAGQAVIPTTNWMYPVTDIGDALPPAFAQAPKPGKVLAIDEADITANSGEWIAQAPAAIQ